MNKEEQIKFIEDNYPFYTNHISNRRIRHDFLVIQKLNYKHIFQVFMQQMEVQMKKEKHLEYIYSKKILNQYIFIKI